MQFKVFNYEKYGYRMDRLFQELEESGLTGRDLSNALQSDILLALAAQLDEDIAAALEGLEERLRGNQSFRYEGIHEQARQYERGQFVTKNGSLWQCNRLTRQRPGDGNDWQLAAKED